MKTPKGDTPVMTEITRNEMKDTLSAIENRMDKRIDRMEKRSFRGTSGRRASMKPTDVSKRRATGFTRSVLKRQTVV